MYSRNGFKNALKKAKKRSNNTIKQDEERRKLEEEELEKVLKLSLEDASPSPSSTSPSPSSTSPSPSSTSPSPRLFPSPSSSSLSVQEDAEFLLVLKESEMNLQQDEKNRKDDKNRKDEEDMLMKIMELSLREENRRGKEAEDPDFLYALNLSLQEQHNTYSFGEGSSSGSF